LASTRRFLFLEGLILAPLSVAVRNHFLENFARSISGDISSNAEMTGIYRDGRQYGRRSSFSPHREDRHPGNFGRRWPRTTTPDYLETLRRLGAKIAGTCAALSAPGEFFERLVGNRVQCAKRGSAALRAHLQLSRDEFPRLVIAAMREHPAYPFQHDVHIGDRALVQLGHGSRFLVFAHVIQKFLSKISGKEKPKMSPAV
jgi:hypothetical protein